MGARRARNVLGEGGDWSGERSPLSERAAGVMAWAGGALAGPAGSGSECACPTNSSSNQKILHLLFLHLACILLAYLFVYLLVLSLFFHHLRLHSTARTWKSSSVARLFGCKGRRARLWRSCYHLSRSYSPSASRMTICFCDCSALSILYHSSVQAV